ncbi:MAG: WD40 repeat domain-containing protein [Planctomycetes bacterium]|nr:WD40 repeat domain-containing protein [Planctomycetota bacterium]
MRGKLVAAVAILAFVGIPRAQQPAKPPPLPPINPAAARLDATINGLDGPGFAIAADEQCTFLAAACENGTVQFWHRDVILGLRPGDRNAQELTAHRGPVMALAWCAESRLVSAGADKRIYIWEMPEGKALYTLTASAVVRALAASPDGKRLASAEEAAVQLWDASTGKATSKLTGPTDALLCVAFSPDGTRVAAGGYDSRLYLWDLATGKKLVDVPAHPPIPANTEERPLTVVDAVAFSPDGKEVAVGGADGRIHQFGAADGKLLRSLSGHTSAVTSLVYHPAGPLLVSGSKDGSVRLWNPANGQALKTLEGHTAWVQGVTLLEKGTRLASVGADQTVRLWDLTTPKP